MAVASAKMRCPFNQDARANTSLFCANARPEFGGEMIAGLLSVLLISCVFWIMSPCFYDAAGKPDIFFPFSSSYHDKKKETN